MGHGTFGQLESPTSSPFAKLQRLCVPATSRVSQQPIADLRHVDNYSTTASGRAMSSLPILEVPRCLDYDSYDIPDSPPFPQHSEIESPSGDVETSNNEFHPVWCTITDAGLTLAHGTSSHQPPCITPQTSAQQSTNCIGTDGELASNNEYLGQDAFSLLVGSESFKEPVYEDDSYSLGSSDEEEMARLLDNTTQAAHVQIPSSSSIQQMARGPSIEEFDPSLRHSSLENCVVQAPATAGEAKECVEEDLLSSDIDWDDILPVIATNSNGKPYAPPDEKLN